MRDASTEVVKWDGKQRLLGRQERQGFTPAQYPCGGRVGGGSHGARTRVSTYIQCVRVHPAQARLGCRKIKTAGNEAQGGQVKLPVSNRVAAVGGQSHHGVPVVIARGGPQQGRPGPQPLGVLRRGQGVNIQQNLPVGGLAQIALPQGAPPQPPRVGLVAPEVVIPRTALGDHGDAVFGIQYLKHGCFEGFVGGVEQGGVGAIIVFTDPVHGVFAMDVF